MLLLTGKIRNIRGEAAAVRTENTAFGLFGEERCLELQKWKRRASPWSFD